MCAEEVTKGSNSSQNGDSQQHAKKEEGPGSPTSLHGKSPRTNALKKKLFLHKKKNAMEGEKGQTKKGRAEKGTFLPSLSKEGSVNERRGKKGPCAIV